MMGPRADLADQLLDELGRVREELIRTTVEAGIDRATLHLLEHRAQEVYDRHDTDREVIDTAKDALVDLLARYEQLKAEHDALRSTGPPAADRLLWRVRWWREGWSRGEGGANSRIFMRERPARVFARHLRDRPSTRLGVLEVRLERCQATPWEATR